MDKQQSLFGKSAPRCTFCGVQVEVEEMDVGKFCALHRCESEADGTSDDDEGYSFNFYTPIFDTADKALEAIPSRFTKGENA